METFLKQEMVARFMFRRSFVVCLSKVRRSFVEVSSKFCRSFVEDEGRNDKTSTKFRQNFVDLLSRNASLRSP